MDPTDPQPEQPDSKPIAYETPSVERPASASPTEAELENERAGRPKHDPYAALRYPNYRLYTIGNALATFGGQVQTVAITWEVWVRTQSPTAIAWLAAVQAIPMLLLSLPAGHIADSRSRQKTVILTQTFGMLMTLGLAVLSWQASNQDWAIPVLFALVFLRASAMTVFRPARNALMPSLVPPAIFSNAVTWNSSLFELTGMIGPAIGGFIVARHLPSAYLLSGALQGAFIVTAIAMRVQEVPRTGESISIKSLASGLRFVWSVKTMLAAMTLDLFAVLLGGVTYLLPIFATQRLHVGAVGHGWLRTAPAIGAFTTAMVIAHTPPLRRAGRTLLLCVAGFGVATIVFGLSTNFALSFAMLLLTGMCDNVSVVIRHSLVQMQTPDSMRGRVSSVNQIFIGSSNELGGLESGITAALFGPVISAVMGGIGTIIVVLTVGTLFPKLRQLKSLQELSPVDEDFEKRPQGFEVIAASPASEADSSSKSGSNAPL